jgi:hypothetical protein
VIHFLGQSRKHRSWFSYLNLHRSRLIFFRKHYGMLQARILWLGYVLVTLGKALRAILSHFVSNKASTHKFLQNKRLIYWLLAKQDVFRKESYAHRY